MVTITLSMLSSRQQKDSRNIKFEVTGSDGGMLMLDGERANYFSEIDVAAGAVKFVQHGNARPMYDGGLLGGFGFTFTQQGRTSRPLFFPVAVLQNKPIPVPQARLLADQFPHTP